MTSSKYTINRNDLIKGLLMTVIAAILTTAYQLLVEVGLDWTADDFKEVVIIALTTGISYLLKNFFTDGQTQQADEQLMKRNNTKK